MTATLEKNKQNVEFWVPVTPKALDDETLSSICAGHLPWAYVVVALNAKFKDGTEVVSANTIMHNKNIPDFCRVIEPHFTSESFRRACNCLVQ